jgi:hypothetical protein
MVIESLLYTDYLILIFIAGGGANLSNNICGLPFQNNAIGLNWTTSNKIKA